jgi:hypothetical protein
MAAAEAHKTLFKLQGNYLKLLTGNIKSLPKLTAFLQRPSVRVMVAQVNRIV